MRRLLLISGFLLLLPFSAAAQEAPRAELLGGYSYFRAEGGGNLHGWNASVSGNLNRWFGLVADFGGHYGEASTRIVIDQPGFPTFSAEVEADARIHTFLAGPRFSYRQTETLTPFAHVLFGAARAQAEGSVSLSGVDTITVDFDESDTAFALAVGGGLDVKLSRRVALRLVQADYVMTRFNSDTQNNARLSVGLVFRFGEE